jgi:hypothetical protein
VAARGACAAISKVGDRLSFRWNETCRLPALLPGQYGAQQAWPTAKPNIAVQLMGIFPKTGTPDPNDDQFYEMVLDEVAGHYTMRRRPDAPPLALSPVRSRSDTVNP